MTLLDINNSVPKDLYEENNKPFTSYKLEDIFMGFHCGNTPICKLKKGGIKYQLIQNRLMETAVCPTSLAEHWKATLRRKSLDTAL